MNQILLFTAGFCKPCKNIKSFLPEIKSDIEIELIDIEEDTSDIVSELKIRSVPTFVFIKNNKEIHRNVGSISRDHLQSTINHLYVE